ncbi:MAG: hypothetical protein EIB84_01845 [Spiroplasma poulsonii]|uniref:Uncharacterized protein n=1 Tax=Spiroplasma poulsonii TaxID=2138 RepID=A0A2P6FBM3_9MOLU|nr:hypothetical protein [Spiroplasma poulsonii]KAF0851265.1 hypothetical protein MSROBK_006870 [Spiroplasma poulsonii]MBW1241631.1 hypothetical protein [Spiroplasma poulsonii]PQM30859.1 hypothetical protein SMSRO_SF006510 [Spiroplasma poulsonii]PWF95852.1 hypothetical protein SMSE_12890 [Spiroplasma poulsonii]PWF98629.1 hypothetical protein SMH99_11910 [Spiroplasma poulsonii]
METRMEKFAQLREMIKKEIELDQEINQANQVINSYMAKLNVIDATFFNNVKSDFEQEFSWEKVYLDKNPDEQPYPSDFKYDLQQLLEQVVSTTNLSAQVNLKNDQDAGDIMHNILIAETLLNKPTYQKYQTILESILAEKITYHRLSDKIQEENSDFKINSTNIEFSTIAHMRKNDNRSTAEMLKESSILLEEKHNNVLVTYRKIKLHYKMLLLTILLLVILLGACLALIFVL